MRPGTPTLTRLVLLSFVGLCAVAWIRLCVRIGPGVLEIRNLFSKTSFDLGDETVAVSLRDKKLHARKGEGPSIRAWGVSGQTSGRLEVVWIPRKRARLVAAVHSKSP